MEGARGIRRLAACLALATALAGPATASVLETPEFRAVLASDFGADAVLAFADRAARHGEPDAAIAALEQLLTRRPGLAEAHARLARLYAAVGNAELAAMHAAAAPAPATDPPTADPAPATGTAWSLALGLDWDSNPTAAPRGGTVAVFDPVGRAFVPVALGDADGDVVASVRLDGQFLHRLSPEALLAAEISVAGEKYLEEETLDAVTLAVSAGPWLALGGSGRLAVRPWAGIGAATLDGQPWSGTLAGGVMLRYAAAERLVVSGSLEAAHVDYAAGLFDGFDADRLDGPVLALGAGVEGATSGGILWALQARAGTTRARARSERHVSLGLSAGAALPLAPAARALGRPVVLRLSGSLDRDAYRAPDATVDPFTRRRDVWLGAGLALEIGLTDQVGLALGVDYLRQLSTVALYETQSVSSYARLGVAF